MESVNDTGTPAFNVEDRHTAGVMALEAAGRLVTGVGAGHPGWQAARASRGTSRVALWRCA